MRHLYNTYIEAAAKTREQVGIPNLYNQASRCVVYIESLFFFLSFSQERHFKREKRHGR